MVTIQSIHPKLINGIVLFILVSALGVFAGDYTVPPGEPGSEAARMRTLNEVEPRNPISSLPYTISEPGAYFLPTSLDAAPLANGISISASDVQIDLNGFSLKGASEALNAIEVTANVANIAIRNGVIRNWGGFGIMATSAVAVTVSDIKAIGNGMGGIYTGPNAYIERCSADQNGFDAGDPVEPPRTDGIQCGPYSTVIDCKVRGNLGAGIHTYDHTRIIGCTATESFEADGVFAEDYCIVRDCVTAKNEQNGIKVGSMCRVADNISGQNGTTTTNGAGIFIVGFNSVIEQNHVCNNYYGIKTRSDNAAGNLIIRNSASGNTNDFYFVAGDYYGRNDDRSPGAIGSEMEINAWMNFILRR